jgi:hypothetical protein
LSIPKWHFFCRSEEEGDNNGKNKYQNNSPMPPFHIFLLFQLNKLSAKMTITTVIAKNILCLFVHCISGTPFR